MTALSYRDASGIWREIAVRPTPAGDWEVLDSCSGESRVIETLDGREDDEPQAVAVARDYLTAGRFTVPPGRRPAEAISEQGEADANSDPCPRSAARLPRTRRTALPHPAR